MLMIKLMKTLLIVFERNFKNTERSCFVDLKRFLFITMTRTKRNEIGQSTQVRRTFKNIGNHVDSKCKNISIGSDSLKSESLDFQQQIHNERQSLLKKMI